MGIQAQFVCEPQISGSLTKEPVLTCRDLEVMRCPLNEAKDWRTMQVPYIVPPNPKSLAS